MNRADPLLPITLALALAATSPAMLARPPAEARLGNLIKTVATIDGPLKVYRDVAGCSVIWKGVVADRVDMATCSA